MGSIPPWVILPHFLLLLSLCDCARLLGSIRDVHSIDYHRLIPEHRKIETSSHSQGRTFNFFPRGVPLPPSGPSKRRNMELGPGDSAQREVGGVRLTDHHQIIPELRKLETGPPISFARRAPLPPSAPSKRQNTELSPSDYAHIQGSTGDFRSTDHHRLIPEHRRIETGSHPQGRTFNFFPRGVPLPPSGTSKRRNMELGTGDSDKRKGVIGGIRSTDHHRIIPEHRKLETGPPISFPRRAPLPPSAPSKRRNTELNPNDYVHLQGSTGDVPSTDHDQIIADRRNLETGFHLQGQMFNFLPRGVPLPPSAPSKRRNAEIQSNQLP